MYGCLAAINVLLNQSINILFYFILFYFDFISFNSQENGLADDHRCFLWSRTSSRGIMRLSLTLDMRKIIYINNDVSRELPEDYKQQRKSQSSEDACYKCRRNIRKKKKQQTTAYSAQKIIIYTSLEEREHHINATHYQAIDNVYIHHSLETQ